MLEKVRDDDPDVVTGSCSTCRGSEIGGGGSMRRGAWPGPVRCGDDACICAEDPGASLGSRRGVAMWSLRGVAGICSETGTG